MPNTITFKAVATEDLAVSMTKRVFTLDAPNGEKTEVHMDESMSYIRVDMKGPPNAAGERENWGRFRVNLTNVAARLVHEIQGRRVDLTTATEH